MTRERFEAMIAAGEFLEWADVFGNLYGTCAADTERLLAAGDDVVLVIDVQGARQVRARGLAATTVFVMPPSFEVLEQRLRGRSKDSEAAIQRRLQVAREEVAAFSRVRLSSSSTTSSTAPSIACAASSSPSARGCSGCADAAESISQDILMIDRSKLSNSFEFVVTAGARARQLLAGSTPRVAVGEHKKTTVAQQEVITKAVEKIEKDR